MKKLITIVLAGVMLIGALAAAVAAADIPEWIPSKPDVQITVDDDGNVSKHVDDERAYRGNYFLNVIEVTFKAGYLSVLAEPDWEAILPGIDFIDVQNTAYPTPGHYGWERFVETHGASSFLPDDYSDETYEYTATINLFATNEREDNYDPAQLWRYDEAVFRATVAKLEALDYVKEVSIIENTTFGVESKDFGIDPAKEYTSGDVNGDGKLNAKDVLAILRYCISQDANGIDLTIADFNQDGKINSRDAVGIMKLVCATR